jgi:hypothetical protein
MSVITGGTIIEGGSPPRLGGAGAPVNGTDEIQTITIGGAPEAGSTFRLTYDGWRTAAIAWSATNNTLRDNVDAALEALPNIGSGGVTTAVGTMTLGVGTLTVTFVAQNGKRDVALMVGSEFLQSTGAASASGTVAVATTTPGVDATGRGTAAGSVYYDRTNGVMYINTGTAVAPTWVSTDVSGINTELTTLASAVPTAAVADLGAVTSAAVAGTTPAGGTGATAGAYDTANNRDALIATVAEMKVTVNAIRVDLAADRAKLNDLLAKLRTAGIVTP